MARTPVDIRSLARAQTATCIRTLTAIMRQKQHPPAARVAAANSLLDRGWGRPHQDTTTTSDIRITVRNIVDVIDVVEENETLTIEHQDES